MGVYDTPTPPHNTDNLETMAEFSRTEISTASQQTIEYNTDTDDEVKTKPDNKQQYSLEEPPEAEAATDYYYDILVVGKTGMGKSSTVDKVMVPNTPVVTIPKQEHDEIETSDLHRSNIQIVSSTAAQNNRQRRGEVVNSRKPLKKTSTDQKRGSGIEEVSGAHGENRGLDESLDMHRDKTQWENLTGWVLSTDQDEHANFLIRLKNIIFCRQTYEKEPHINVDELRNADDLRESVYKSSRSCQLLTNENSRIQILDTPGFFSADFMEGATNTKDSNLAVVRHIVRIQALAGLRFQRVLYFLPTGPLKRADRVIQQEIQEMVKFFGVSIFKRMVLVGTAASHTSEDLSLSTEQKFPAKKLEQSRNLFCEALVREYQEKRKDTTRLPRPPIILITMTDTCEQILDKITSADIENDSNDGLKLEFNTNTCCRCGIETGVQEDDTLMAEYRGPGEAPWSNAIPYKQSLCHPYMHSTYTARSVFRGFARLLLLEWNFSEEKCISCHKGPGAQGCKQVNTIYEENGYQPIKVDHTYNMDTKRARASIESSSETSIN